jgi:hypothetical protein
MEYIIKLKIEYLHTNKYIYSIDRELSIEEYNSFLEMEDPSKYGFLKEREFTENNFIEEL